jgi:hypothetical protein
VKVSLIFSPTCCITTRWVRFSATPTPSALSFLQQSECHHRAGRPARGTAGCACARLPRTWAARHRLATTLKTKRVSQSLQAAPGVGILAVGKKAAWFHRALVCGKSRGRSRRINAHTIVQTMYHATWIPRLSSRVTFRARTEFSEAQAVNRGAAQALIPHTDHSLIARSPLPGPAGMPLMQVPLSGGERTPVTCSASPLCANSAA